MRDDPIVAAIRAMRNEHAAQHGYDVKRIFATLKAQQKESGRHYVRYPSRPASRQPLQRRIDTVSQSP